LLARPALVFGGEKFPRLDTGEMVRLVLGRLVLVIPRRLLEASLQPCQVSFLTLFNLQGVSSLFLLIDNICGSNITGWSSVETAQVFVPNEELFADHSTRGECSPSKSTPSISHLDFVHF
jgi:hypothetical protein